MRQGRQVFPFKDRKVPRTTRNKMDGNDFICNPTRMLCFDSFNNAYGELFQVVEKKKAT